MEFKRRGTDNVLFIKLTKDDQNAIKAKCLEAGEKGTFLTHFPSNTMKDANSSGSNVVTSIWKKVRDNFLEYPQEFTEFFDEVAAVIDQGKEGYEKAANIGDSLEAKLADTEENWKLLMKRNRQKAGQEQQRWTNRTDDRARLVPGMEQSSINQKTVDIIHNVLKIESTPNYNNSAAFLRTVDAKIKTLLDRPDFKNVLNRNLDTLKKSNRYDTSEVEAAKKIIEQRIDVLKNNEPWGPGSRK